MVNLVMAGVLAAAALSAPALSSAPPAPPAGQVTVQAVSTNGSACRPGRSLAVVSPDNQAFTVLFSQYLAADGGGNSGKAKQKCKLNVDLGIPSGWTYAVVQADHRGYALLQPGATAALQATYKFQGDGSKAATVHPFTGPFDDFWARTDTAGSLVFAPCGKVRRLNIDTELHVSGGSGSAEGSYIAMDSSDGSVATTYRLVWRTCSA